MNSKIEAARREPKHGLAVPAYYGYYESEAKVACALIMKYSYLFAVHYSS